MFNKLVLSHMVAEIQAKGLSHFMYYAQTLYYLVSSYRDSDSLSTRFLNKIKYTFI